MFRRNRKHSFDVILDIIGNRSRDLRIESLNIPAHTFPVSSVNNLIQEPSTATSVFNAKNSSHLFGLSLLVTNTMSLAPKIDEVNYFATCKNPEAISENCINIPGYYLTCKNRSTGAHGGVFVGILTTQFNIKLWTTRSRWRFCIY